MVRWAVDHRKAFKKTPPEADRYIALQEARAEHVSGKKYPNYFASSNAHIRIANAHERMGKTSEKELERAKAARDILYGLNKDCVVGEKLVLEIKKAEILLPSSTVDQKTAEGISLILGKLTRRCMGEAEHLLSIGRLDWALEMITRVAKIYKMAERNLSSQTLEFQVGAIAINALGFRLSKREGSECDNEARRCALELGLRHNRAQSDEKPLIASALRDFGLAVSFDGAQITKIDNYAIPRIETEQNLVHLRLTRSE